MLRFAFLAGLLTAPAFCAGSATQLWNQPDNSSMTQLQSHKLHVFALEFESADDFDLVGTIGKVAFAGNFGVPFSTITNVASAHVRFYAWTPTGPGALLFHDVIAKSDPNFTPNALTLHTPFVSNGKCYVSVQFEADPLDLIQFDWSDANWNAPVLGGACQRVNGGTWSQKTHDLAFELWSPANLPPAFGSDPCGTWNEIDTPAWPANATQGQFSALDVLGHDDVWAVGQAAIPNPPSHAAGIPLAMHWDGSIWTPTPTPITGPLPGDGDSTFHGVKAFAPNDVWAAGWQEITGSGQFFGPEILAMHWDGAQWSIVPTPIPGASVGGLSGANGSHVTAIDGVAPDDVWFVGLWMQPVPAGTFLETGLAMHWDGAQMTVYPTPYAQGPSGFTGGYILNDVLAFASNDVWAVGNGLNTWTPVPYVLRWDGVQWDLVDVPLVEPWFQFHEIVGTSSSNLFISGSVRDANFVETRVLLHFDGSNWTQQPTPPFGPSSLYMAPTGVLYATSFGIDRFENGTWTHVADVTTNQQQPLVGSIDGFGECELYVVGSKTTVNLGTRPFSARLFPDLWSDLGGGAVGATGVPTLTGKGAPIAGSTILVSLESAPPNTLATMFVGLTPFAQPAFGGTFWPQPTILLAGLPTDASGALDLWIDWPVGVPSGVQLYMQDWMVDPGAPFGVTGSNGLLLQTP